MGLNDLMARPPPHPPDWMNEQGLLEVPEPRSSPELYSWSTGARVDFCQVRDTSTLQLILFTFTVGRNLSDQDSSKETQSFKTLAFSIGWLSQHHTYSHPPPLPPGLYNHCLILSFRPCRGHSLKISYLGLPVSVRLIQTLQIAQ